LETPFKQLKCEIIDTLGYKKRFDKNGRNYGVLIVLVEDKFLVTLISLCKQLFDS